MIVVTLLLILLHFVVAMVSPARFIFLALWVQTIPYTWNWNTQLIFDTPVGQLNVVAMQVFGLLFSSLLVVGRNIEAVMAQASKFVWHFMFILLCGISLAYAPSLSFGIRMIAKLLGPLMFMLAVVTTLDSQENLRKAETAIIGSGVILIILAIVARLLGIEVDPNASLSGRAGLGPPGMGPPVFAAHMLPVSMLALAAYLRDKNTKMLLLLVISALCILAAYQRTCAAAMYLGFSVILFIGTRGILRLLLPMIGVLALPALIVFSDDFRRRMFFGSHSSGQIIDDPMSAIAKIDSSGRFSLWDTALHKFFYDHPMQGSGIGATQDYLYGISRAGLGVVHSEYVRLLCEVGVIGLALFAIAMLAYGLRLVAHGRENGRINKYTLAAIGSLVAYLIYCATDNGLDYVSQFGAYVFGLVAMAFKEYALAVNQRVSESASPGVDQMRLFPNVMR